ncbi:MAG: transcription-repair coupling factor, partial [Anaerolineales bacterium]
PIQQSLSAPTVVLASARAVMARTLSLHQFLTHSRWLQTGTTCNFIPLLELLVGSGYDPHSLVTEPGQFSRRGGILDLWPPAEPLPVRVEFFGDDIESMRAFDPGSQRSTQSLEHLRLTPAREGIPWLYQDSWDEWLPAGEDPEDPHHARSPEFFLPWMNPAPTGVLDFLPEQAVVLVDDMMSFKETVGDLEEQAVALGKDQAENKRLPPDFPLPYLTIGDIEETLRERTALDLGLLSGPSADTQTPDLADHFQPGPRFGGQLKPLMEHLSKQRLAHEAVVVVSRQAPRLAALWGQEAEPTSAVDDLTTSVVAGDIHFVHGALSEGWTLLDEGGTRLHLLTDAEIFGWARPRARRRARIKRLAPESTYADLRPGDWVVHIDYGVGRFEGLVERTLDQLPREFLMVAYAEGDQLFVPIHQADRISRYVGVGGLQPRASRLGTQEWIRTKRKAQDSVEEIARSLLELYARRLTVSGHAFPPDSDWQRELEASFPYGETEDQLRAVVAVKRDMEQPRPMDRLICGDAGYGKTEVALRASFKAVMGGKQVGMLVPTTVLAQQHFDTFRRRLAAFPVEVEMVSRFRSRKQNTEILKRLSRGEIDIVIGTHRLLQRDVHFKDLGLLIIDEEQRFGVTHKEYLKQMRTEVDVLTMTATPIPRTLYMALTGVRDISTINTPPEERLPSVTHVGPYDPRVIRRAILREMERGGQTFFVHNRVQTIGAMLRRLERLVPEASMAVAHGQMHEQQLAQSMEAFNKGECDVLVSTSIIESGLDIPNANTLIVDRADTFGLAQLYQLRGRVGRAATRAYAYFFRHPHRRASEDGLQRLEFLAEHSQLGAGYSIALRDLEMRGAGEILGTRQHGHIAAIGFHLYSRLLANSVRRLRRQEGAEVPTLDRLPYPGDQLPVAIDLPMACSIPADYVPERDLRLQLYRRMAEMRTRQEIDSLITELADRFGPPPLEVSNLVYQLRIKVLALQAGVEAISYEKGQLLIQRPSSEDTEPMLELGDDVRRSKRGYWLTLQEGSDWKSRLIEMLVALSQEPAPA